MAFFWPLFCKAQLWSVQLKVVLWTYTPISAVELCSSFRVIFGLFVASLMNALLARSVSFGGRPSLGRFVVVPYSFHFFNNGFNDALWADLYFSTTLSLACLESSLVFIVPLAWWSPLLSGVADSGAFQNRCIQYILRSCDT